MTKGERRMKRRILKLITTLSFFLVTFGAVMALNTSDTFVENGMHYQVINTNEVKVIGIDNIASMKDIVIPVQVEKDATNYMVKELDYTIFNSANSIVTITLPDSIKLSDIGGTVEILKNKFTLTQFNITPVTSSKDLILYSMDGVLYATETTHTELLFFPKGKGGVYTLPDNVDRIADDIFYGATKVEEFNFPASYTGSIKFLESNFHQINNAPFANYVESKDGPFEYTSSLKAINVIDNDPNVENGYTSIDGICYTVKQGDVLEEIVFFPGNWQGSVYTIPKQYQGTEFVDFMILCSLPNLESVVSPEDKMYGHYYIDDGSVIYKNYWGEGRDAIWWVASNKQVLHVNNRIEAIRYNQNYTGFYNSVFKTPGIKEIIVAPDNPYFYSENGIMYSKDGSKLIKYPEQKEESMLEIKNGVKVIYQEAFVSNSKLKTVVIPDSVTTIENSSFAMSNIEYIYINGDTLSDVLEFSFANIDFQTGNIIHEGNLKAIYCEDANVMQAVKKAIGPTAESIVLEATFNPTSINDDVKVKVNKDHSVTITWSGNSDGYEIRRYTNKARSNYTVAGSVEGTTTFTDKDAIQGENVTYAVVPYSYMINKSVYEDDPFKDKIEYGTEVFAKKEVYVEKTYTVTFIGKDGTVLKEEVVKANGKAIAPEAPKIEGYTFEKWDKDYSKVNSNLIVQAIYKEEVKIEVPSQPEEEKEPEEVVQPESIENEKGNIVDTSDGTSLIGTWGMLISSIYFITRKKWE